MSTLDVPHAHICIYCLSSEFFAGWVGWWRLHIQISIADKPFPPSPPPKKKILEDFSQFHARRERCWKKWGKKLPDKIFGGHFFYQAPIKKKTLNQDFFSISALMLLMHGNSNPKHFFPLLPVIECFRQFRFISVCEFICLDTEEERGVDGGGCHMYLHCTQPPTLVCKMKAQLEYICIACMFLHV